MTESRETYSHGHHDSVLRSHRWRTVENSAGYLLPYLKPEDDLLDIGTGPGTITVDLGRRLNHGSVTGIDNAAEAVEVTQQLVAESAVSNVQVAVGDVSALDFADGTLTLFMPTRSFNT
jgi:ubiquinone/menaquinone biosynthesis C-methylase UbiE